MLDKLFYYDETSPTFLRNKIQRNPCALADAVAGSAYGKRFRLTQDGAKLWVHDIIWELHNGALPEGFNVSFISGYSNSIDNLELTPVIKENKKVEVIDWAYWFLYDESSPTCLTNKVPRSTGAKVGAPSGTLSTGLRNTEYYVTSFKGKLYQTHRIIWELHNGPIPAGLVIDHIDRNSLNNKIDNLRCITQGNNTRNTKARTASGHKGISKSRSGTRWCVASRVDQQYLKTVDTIEEGLQLQREDVISRLGHIPDLYF